MTNENFNLRSFIDESVLTLSNPKKYFSEMPVSGGYKDPLLKAIIYGAISGILIFIWSLLHINGGGFSFFNTGIRILIPVWYLIGSILALMICSGLLILASTICNGKTDFEHSLRVSASLMVLMPVSTLLDLSHALGHGFGSLISLMINLYGLFLLYHALISSLGGKEKPAKILVIILAALLALSLLLGFMGKRAFDNNGYDFSSRDKTEESVLRMQERMMQKAVDYAEKYGDEELANELSEGLEEMNRSREGYEIEMANGDRYDSPSNYDILSAVSSLDKENDYIILKNGKDYLQAAGAEKGYTVEYREDGNDYRATSEVSREVLVIILYAYISGEDDWNAMLSWEEF